MYQQAAERVTKSIPDSPGAQVVQVPYLREMPSATRNAELAADAMHAMAANGFGDATL